MYCVHCGAELSDREEICSLCGKLSKVPDEKIEEPIADGPKTDEPARDFEAGEAGRPATDMPSASAETTAFCPVCKQYAYLDANGCCNKGHHVKSAEEAIRSSGVGQPAAAGTYPGDIPVETFLDNNSGRGNLSVLPQELGGVNWGAFLLTWIWGIGNKVWLSFLVFFPGGNTVMPWVLLIKGNEWAWKNRRWDSVDQFRDVQRQWAIAGIVVTIIAIIVLCGCYWSLFTMGAIKPESGS